MYDFMTYGNHLKFTIFGESHGVGVGVVLRGLPAGIKIDEGFIQNELNRRKPGQSKISTPRKEDDRFTILSGVYNGRTTGAPLAMFINNSDMRSKDYSKFRDVPRPSQIDYPALLRFGEYVDLRGSGIFSGRLTAPIVMVGAIAKILLKQKNVKVAAYISKIGEIEDNYEYTVDEIIENYEKTPVRTVDMDMAEKMVKKIEEMAKERDSIGGIVSVRIEGVPPGIGSPWFGSIESLLSAAMFAIPGVKGVEFGSGFKCAEMRGSVHNDPYIIDPNNPSEIKTKTNNSGGIIGGISIGMPITFRVAIKPTASIGKSQKTINIKKKKMTDLIIEGRHDPCIAPRAAVAIESMAAFVMADLLLDFNI